MALLVRIHVCPTSSPAPPQVFGLKFTIHPAPVDRSPLDDSVQRLLSSPFSETPVPTLTSFPCQC